MSQREEQGEPQKGRDDKYHVEVDESVYYPPRSFLLKAAVEEEEIANDAMLRKDMPDEADLPPPPVPRYRLPGPRLILLSAPIVFSSTPADPKLIDPVD